MMRLPIIALTLVVAIPLLLVADRLLQPVPVPAATAVAAGLLAVWLGRRTAIWAIAGLFPGVGLHTYVHSSGGSPPPEEGVVAHLALDGLYGLIVAAPILLLVTLLAKGLSARHARLNDS